jgi:hypothetical protein
VEGGKEVEGSIVGGSRRGEKRADRVSLWSASLCHFIPVSLRHLVGFLGFWCGLM